MDTPTPNGPPEPNDGELTPEEIRELAEYLNCEEGDWIPAEVVLRELEEIARQREPEQP